MDIGWALNQTVSIQRRTGVNEFGEATYGATELISARYEQRTGMRRSMMGEDIEVESYVLTKEPVALGDVIEGSEVRRVIPTVHINGETVGYEAYL